jgi:hypothetical protein
MSLDQEITAALRNCNQQDYARLLRLARCRLHDLEDALRSIRDYEPITNGSYAVDTAIPALRGIAITALASQSDALSKQGEGP